jgi:hypothetical protein
MASGLDVLVGSYRRSMRFPSLIERPLMIPSVSFRLEAFRGSCPGWCHFVSVIAAECYAELRMRSCERLASAGQRALPRRAEHRTVRRQLPPRTRRARRAALPIHEACRREPLRWQASRPARWPL